MPDGPSLVDELKACEVAEPCRPSFVQLVEGSSRTLSTERDTRCVLEALRDRLPGRYQHSTDSTDSATSAGVDHVIVVGDDGNVLHAARSHSSKYDGSSSQNSSGERCRLKEEAYFEACLEGLDAASVAGGGGAGNDTWDCLFDTDPQSPRTLGWLEGCEPAETLACE
jgi:hypothetical protein